MTQPEVQLTDPRALRGYAHPLRLALVGLLRREGPLTATQAAERLNESVPSCSYHLRQLARYGLAERVAGADERERPWRATASTTSWDDTSDDPEVRAATDQLNAVILEHYLQRARAHLALRAHEPQQWRALTGFGDTILYLTAEELAELTRRMETLLTEYDDRLTDPTKRPDGSRAIAVIQLVLPTEPVPADAASDRAVGPQARSDESAGESPEWAGRSGAPADESDGTVGQSDEPAGQSDEPAGQSDEPAGQSRAATDAYGGPADRPGVSTPGEPA
ncbi:winged helix-turn-helix domain-containing protein [Plantactinospora sonchi]|uniref:Helix-turn-helix domain-containing protein n=1 Tax=Plantactinospora sonchi TaxID=1544735 RepID=A0ABU7RKT8_9ACTN